LSYIGWKKIIKYLNSKVRVRVRVRARVRARDKVRVGVKITNRVRVIRVSR
jgi:translation initiation factor IF-3